MMGDSAYLQNKILGGILQLYILLKKKKKAVGEVTIAIKKFILETF